MNLEEALLKLDLLEKENKKLRHQISVLEDILYNDDENYDEYDNDYEKYI